MKESKDKELYTKWSIWRWGHCIASKTYSKPKTENQLRHYAVSYMVDRDISTKYPFIIRYE